MGRPTVTCYSKTGKDKETQIVEAFAKGAGGQVVTDGQVRDGVAAFYGFGPHNRTVFDVITRQGRDWYYIDNGYFSSTFTSKGEAYYRVTKKRLQHSGIGNGDPRRFAKHGIEIQPWKEGHHILICPPRKYWCRWTWDIDHERWLKATLAEVRANTDRAYRVRYKPINPRKDNTFYDDLKDCHALVTFMSNTAIEALVYGVPVFCSQQSAAWPVSGGSLDNIDRPAHPGDRLQWASVLAANQWTLEEMASGKCWRDLNE